MDEEQKNIVNTAKAEAKRIIKEANQNGFTVDLSANNLAHADKLKALNIAPVVVVLPSTQTTNTETSWKDSWNDRWF